MPTLPLVENTPKTRNEFFEREAETWKVLSAGWRGLSEAELSTLGACGPGWSVKDVMNHIAAWQEVAAKVAVDLMAGRWGQLGSNTQKFNERNYEADQVRSLADTRRRLARSRRELLKVLNTAPVKGLLSIYGRQQIGWWAKYSTYGHYTEHIAALKTFRKQIL